MEIRSGQIPRNTVVDRKVAMALASSPVARETVLEPVDVFHSLPSTYQDPDTRPVVLPTSAPPALPRPVVFVHGFNGDPASFNPLQEWLGSGSNPVNKFGGIVDPSKLGDLDGSANLFSLRLSRPYNGIETNSAELKKTVEAICLATGQKEVDLVVHSLGGLDSRDYLREPDEKVKRFVMLGTPNHGSQLSNLELVFREEFGYPIKPPVDDEEVRTVLHQLTVDKNKNGRPANPYLRELNNGWEQQRAKADIMIFAGSGIPTLTGTPGITAFGDGVVARDSAKLDGVETKTAWFKTHGGLFKSANVMENAAAFLATGKALTDNENLYDSVEDEIRAKELMAGTGTAGPIGGGASLKAVQQAAQLPILDPAFQFGIGLGVLAAMMGGPQGTLPLVQIALNSLQGDSQLKADYNIDLERQTDPVRGSGTVNGAPFAEKANLVESKLHWQSQTGAASSGMVVEVGEDERSVALTGQLSGVNANLRIAPFTDASGNIAGLETTGTLNGEQYFMKSTLDIEGILAGRASNNGEMHVVGLVNGQAIEKSYQVGVRRGGDGLHLTAHGTGLNAGQPQSVGVEVHVTNRG